MESVFQILSQSSGEDSAVRYGSAWECLAGIVGRMGFGPTYIWLTSRHLKGGTAEIRFVMGGPGAYMVYITAKFKKKKR